MTKLFSFAGVSTAEGVTKARFAREVVRYKVLENLKHTNVKYVELPHEMTKEDAAKFALAHADFQDAEAQAAFGAKAAPKPVAAPKAVKAPKEPKAPKAAKPVKETTAPVVTDSLDGLSNEKLQAHVDEVRAATAIVNADPVKAGRRKLIKDTLAKVRERETEEQAAEREAAKEAAQLEVDTYMADVTEDVLPKFLRDGNIQ